jgi:hypothetical protein
VNDSRPESEKDKEVGVASTIVDKMKPHQVRPEQSRVKRASLRALVAPSLLCLQSFLGISQ